MATAYKIVDQVTGEQLSTPMLEPEARVELDKWMERGDQIVKERGTGDLWIVTPNGVVDFFAKKIDA